MIDWATKLEDVWNEHGFVENLNLAAREVRHVLRGASTIGIRRHVQDYLNGKNPEFFDEGIIFMSVFNDIEWTKKSHTENVFAQCQKSSGICDPTQARTLVLLEARVSKDVVEWKFQRTSWRMGYCRIA